MERWDAIVIGSGIGGLACAAALSKSGRRVLVLEQHFLAGGLTQTFSRAGYVWDVGLHYLGDMGPEGTRMLDWLSEGRIELAPTGAEFDTVRFPGGFEFTYASPEQETIARLMQAFPESVADIDRFFLALAEAEKAAAAAFRMHALPRALAAAQRLARLRSLSKWVGHTTAEVLEKLVADSRLRAVLSAQWPDHGGSPSTGSFAMHAVVMRHFLRGSRYPRGGAGAFAAALVPVVEAAGGAVRLRSPVAGILLERGRAAGVRLADGTEHRAAAVVSDGGARNTLERLLPEQIRDSEWGREILALGLSPSHVGLYLGLEGDIAAAGAGARNYWCYETWNTETVTWDPEKQERPPLMFVSFPSLKDVRPGARHTAEAVAWVDWAGFERWQDSSAAHRPAEYERLKTLAGERLRAQLERHFPGLAPMIRHVEVSTPLTTAHYTGAPHGAVYGLAVTPQRFLSSRLGVRTPVRRLYLAGQDAVSPGITGAMMGGVLAAAAIEPALLRRLA